MRATRRLLAVGLAAGVLTLAVPSKADPTKADIARAQTLFDEGNAALSKKEYAVACAKFVDSDRLDPGPGTLRALAECEEAQGKLVAARKHLQQAIDRKPQPIILKECVDQMSALEKRMSYLVLRLPENAPSTAIVNVDGVPVAAAVLGEPMPVDPGTHVVTVSAPGRATSTQKVTAKEAGTERLPLVIGAGDADPTSGSPADVPPPTASGTGLRTAGYVLVAGGVVLGAASTYFAFDQKNHFNAAKYDNDPENDKGRTSGTYKVATGITGGAAVVAGVVLILTSPESNVAVRLAPKLTETSTGIMIGGYW